MKKLLSILLLLLAFTPALHANNMVDGRALLDRYPDARNDRPAQSWTDNSRHHTTATHCKRGSKCHAHAHKGHHQHAAHKHGNKHRAHQQRKHAHHKHAHHK